MLKFLNRIDFMRRHYIHTSNNPGQSWGKVNANKSSLIIIIFSTTHENHHSPIQLTVESQCCDAIFGGFKMEIFVIIARCFIIFFSLSSFVVCILLSMFHVSDCYAFDATQALSPAMHTVQSHFDLWLLSNAFLIFFRISFFSPSILPKLLCMLVGIRH